METTSRATPTTAAVTGAYCAVVGLVLGPLVDAPGPHRNFWLFLSVALVGLPSYFFVFGITKSQMVGLWALQPALLKRIAACIVGVISVSTVAWLVLAFLPSAR